MIPFRLNVCAIFGHKSDSVADSDGDSDIWLKTISANSRCMWLDMTRKHG